MEKRFPCPCCGHLTLGDIGGWEICPVCFWEDDPQQLRRPTMAGGANRVSLVQARRDYEQFGACDADARAHVRPPRPDELADPSRRGGH
ncbi:CPCC family cysteine-rich protein [Streptomyces sp. NPDC002537]